MIKCVAIDMDGTLVNSKHVVSEENAQAIKLAQSQGIEVVIATGRSYQEARYVLEDAHIRCPIICVNGAEVRSVEGNKLYSIPLQLKEIHMLTNTLNELDIYYEVYTDEGTYSRDYDKAISTIMDIFMSANPRQDYEKAIEGAKARFDKGMVKLIDSYEPLFENPAKEIYKLLAFSLDQESLAVATGRLKNIETVAVSSSGAENLEITHYNAQKGIALTNFVEQRGISLFETMAIGDNYNDVSMFKRVGRAVAMGNAPKDIHKICHTVTATNDENGVAKAILAILSENR
ncbi:Cof-type HAD-IIB family hydrolase [Bacillus songklensis]|uniref:Cof-type HAD-IIB family hydrolase n=1 Tax=Bacillus songklensis TaxID=1069116 RepID=A0ABV8B7Q1_9BACI